MTDESTESGSAVDTAEPGSTEEPQAAAAEPGAPKAAAPEPEPVPFWQRPNVERYLVPLVVPVAVVLGIVIYVLNISRLFLSAHGHISVALGTIITVVILLGATVLSNVSRLRSTTIVMATVLFVFAIVGGGWLVLGHSQEKSAGGTALAAAGPVTGAPIAITAAPTGGLTFAPVSITVKTGLYQITFKDGAAAPHTLDFDEQSTLWAGLQVNNKGETVKSRIFFGAPGDYQYFCAIPGHRQAGMQGVVHVTGSPITLAAAEAAGKPAK